MDIKNKYFDYCTFLENPFQYRYAISLFEEFKKKNKTLLLIIDSPALSKKLIENGFSDFLDSYKFISNYDKKSIDINSEFNRLEKVFKHFQFRRAYFPEYYRASFLSEDYYRTKLILYLKFYEEIILNNNVKVKYFIQHIGDIIRYYSRKISARIFAERVITCWGSYLFNRFLFSEDYLDRWIISDYNIEPTNEELKYIQSWIDSFKESKKFIHNIPLEDYLPKIKVSYINAIPKIINQFIRRELNYYEDWTLKYYWTDRILPVLRKKILRYIYKEIPKDNDNLIYFPLHYSYDAALTTNAEPFVDQFYLVELIHRFLPNGYKLLIKEHPFALGTYSYRKLKKISKLKDIIVLNPKNNSFEIIQKSKAVMVISSSIGAEALYYEKPVLAFGKTYYTGQNVTIDVEDLTNLPEKILELINFKPAQNDIMKMFARVYRESYPINPNDLISAARTKTPDKIWIEYAKVMTNVIIERCENKLNGN